MHPNSVCTITCIWYIRHEAQLPCRKFKPIGYIHEDDMTFKKVEDKVESFLKWFVHEGTQSVSKVFSETRNSAVRKLHQRSVTCDVSYSMKMK